MLCDGMVGLVEVSSGMAGALGQCDVWYVRLWIGSAGKVRYVGE